MLIPLLAWGPLVVLALFGGHEIWNVEHPFQHDLDVHARCLVAIPLMILAEFVVHRRLAGIVRQFVDRRLISEDDMPRFEAIVASAKRLRNSVAAELAQVALALSVHFMWGKMVLSRSGSWLGPIEGGELHYTAAGAWYAFVTLTIFRLLLFRWYYRVFIWYRFLWQVKGLDLRLDALHPDRVAGLGFLAGSPAIFMPLLLAHSVMVAALVQTKIWNTGAKLTEFTWELGGILGFLAVLSFTPLFFFCAKLALARRKANAQYGALASRYVAEFREKWLAGRATSDTLVGSGDIQSLADLSGAYDAIRETRFVPITRQSFGQLIVGAGLPMLPLALNLMKWNELLEKAMGLLFDARRTPGPRRGNAVDAGRWSESRRARGRASPAHQRRTSFPVHVRRGRSRHCPVAGPAWKGSYFSSGSGLRAVGFQVLSGSYSVIAAARLSVVLPRSFSKTMPVLLTMNVMIPELP